MLFCNIAEVNLEFLQYNSHDLTLHSSMLSAIYLHNSVIP